MWVSPHHPNPPRAATPPEDDGLEVVTLDRKDGEELRVRLKTYNGFPFLWIQAWKPAPDGTLWPRKGSGVSIKIGEVDDLVEALGRVDAMLDRVRGQEPPPARRRRVEDPGNPYMTAEPSACRRGRLDTRSVPPGAIARAPEGAPDFDEFAAGGR